MFKNIILSSVFIAFVKAEGYYCPYDSLGFDRRNDLLYDYYEGKGNYWIRIGKTGWETRKSYCNAKGNAGKEKCQDSQGICMWSSSSCNINPSKKPDCYDLCKAVKNGKGLPCLGKCPTGNFHRNQFYSICNNKQNKIKTRPRMSNT
jgi:hypothetical protein